MKYFEFNSGTFPFRPGPKRAFTCVMHVSIQAWMESWSQNRYLFCVDHVRRVEIVDVPVEQWLVGATSNELILPMHPSTKLPCCWPF